MSFWKFFTRRGKPEDSPEPRRKADKREAEETPANDPEAEKRRLKHSLSISRSGRFKQKKRERSGVLDKPELFEGPGAQGGNAPSPHSRSPGPVCRSTHPRSNMTMGPSVPSVAS